VQKRPSSFTLARTEKSVTGGIRFSRSPFHPILIAGNLTMLLSLSCKRTVESPAFIDEATHAQMRGVYSRLRQNIQERFNGRSRNRRASLHLYAKRK